MVPESIFHLNMGMSKLAYTLKRVVPPEWLLDEDAPPVGIRRNILEKLPIITFLYHLMASSSNILNGSPTTLYYFSSAMGGHQGL